MIIDLTHIEIPKEFFYVLMIICIGGLIISIQNIYYAMKKPIFKPRLPLGFMSGALQGLKQERFKI